MHKPHNSQAHANYLLPPSIIEQLHIIITLLRKVGTKEKKKLRVRSQAARARAHIAGSRKKGTIQVPF